MKMRLGQYADTPLRMLMRGQGRQEIRPRSVARGTACLTWIRI
jgi:hypothetical protein